VIGKKTNAIKDEFGLCVTQGLSFIVIAPTTKINSRRYQTTGMIEKAVRIDIRVFKDFFNERDTVVGVTVFLW
jgi:hypothetical protein